ncbi:putative serine dehydratase domain-containing protein [Xylariaceae sp. FL1272]|nr:putative serine dehydratase domain-containing protein [Xylariaceae sp. FL1272]
MATLQHSKDVLRAQFVGKTLHQVPTPAVVLDLAKVEANCNLMLEAAQRLQLSWRAHIKTHKTEELTRLQVGDNSSDPVNIITSTLAEAEKVVPLLKEYQAKGRKVDVLYSFPLYHSAIDRLAAISSELGPEALTVMVDHPDQIKYLTQLASKSGNPPRVFLKVNMGSNRAGVIPGTPACTQMISQLLLSSTVGSSIFFGLYTHAGHSYAAREDWEAMGILGAEFTALHDVASVVRKERPDHPLVLSVGATPTTTTLQHPDFSSYETESDPTILSNLSATSIMKSHISAMRSEGLTLEVHAGVYPTLDIQQLAAHARDSTYLNPSAIAITVLADVASVYPSRGPNGTSEALINAGCLALGREPVIDAGPTPGIHYSSHGILMPWSGTKNEIPGPEFPAKHGGWQVTRLAQEHGMLSWKGKPEDEADYELKVGQRVRVWPNHSCITGAGYAWYLVVDSRNLGREDEIVDVWCRWNGW